MAQPSTTPAGASFWLGDDDASAVPHKRRGGSGHAASARATKPTGTNLQPTQTFVPIGDERDAAQEFSAIILPFSRKELARAGRRSPDAAKAWKEGRNLPSGWSMLNLAQNIPAVRNWVMSHIGPHEFNANTPRGANALVEAVLAVAAMPGPEGDAVRLILARGGK